MNIISKSASKFVFVTMTLALIAALFTGKISGEQFMSLATMTFAFYFGTRAKSDTQDTTTTVAK